MKNTLASLTAAALALPSLSVVANEQDKDVIIGVKHHSYKEENLHSEDIIGSGERYDIKANQFQLVANISDELRAALNYQTETMSGASPWYTIKNGEGEIVQVMSGASIKDKRNDISANLSFARKLDTFGFTVAHSDEDDYESLSFGASFTRESEDKMSTWSIAGDFSNDDIHPVDTELYSTRPLEGSKHSTSLLFSFSQVLSKTSMLQLSLGYIDRSGLLSDPYKVVFVESQLIGDSRPQSRQAKTLAARYRYFSNDLNGAFHADYRLYDDDWNIRSHTFDLAWYQELGHGIQLIPSIRLYSQTDSYFYDHFYDNTRADGFYSTDYRLSEYGAITYGIKLEKQMSAWTFNVLAEEYRSDGDLGFADASTANPSLLDFSLLSLGVSYSF